ncbi:methylated-DNA--[protein]-cysteine S-methyltransferase [Halomonas denitrificans]|nr:methylated-DNA--[protein]-cysteine S-methyltransferase [Halomonas denitrificans]
MTAPPRPARPDASRDDEFYDALLRRDPAYLGSFVVGVKTTGICCISTCRARKPKRENVAFYPGLKDALAAGYRPCKVCRPAEPASELIEDARIALDAVRAEPKRRLTDADLRALGVRPQALRAWFKAHYGMTFQAYHRMLRINLAAQELQSGKPATETALDSGYDSLSGFGYAYLKLRGAAPTRDDASSPIVMERFDTPLGPMFAAATERGLCLLEFTDRRMLETELRDLQKRLKTTIAYGSNRHTEQAQRELGDYFRGERTAFTLALDAPGTEFQRRVWDALQTIPYGCTASYAEQAQRIGKPSAVRAVARANGMNRIAIVIPCHRVIGKDGALTGYGGGLERKRWLLQHEGAITG